MVLAEKDMVRPSGRVSLSRPPTEDIPGGMGHPGRCPERGYPGMPCPGIPGDHPLPADTGGLPKARSGRGAARTLPSMSSSARPASSIRKNRKTPYVDQNQISRERYSGERMCRNAAIPSAHCRSMSSAEHQRCRVRLIRTMQNRSRATNMKSQSNGGPFTNSTRSPRARAIGSASSSAFCGGRPRVMAHHAPSSPASSSSLSIAGTPACAAAGLPSR